MQKRLFNWIQDRATRGRGRKARVGKCQDGPTELLAPWGSRTRDLTPDPSCADLGQSVPAATSESPFFKILPAEIRRKILIAAFGGRKLHMSLEYNHSRHLVFHASTEKTNVPWVKYVPDGTKYPPQMVRPDPEAPRAWNWRGCPCWYPGISSHPHLCQCLPGVARCWKPGTAVLDICLIGAMGWLLTCKDAYAEGIEVLYSTNIIGLSNGKGSVVLHHLQTLLSPQRLSMITSIDLDLCLYDLMMGPDHDDPDIPPQPDSGRNGFLAILEAIPKAFPRLHTVSLDIYGRLFPKLRLEERPPFYDQFLFEPVDAMVRKLGPELQEVTLILPFTISRKTMHRAIAQGEKFKRHGWEAIFWRSLKPLTGERSQQGMGADGSPGAQGYWITMGHFDDPYPMMGCFGTGSSDPERHQAINKELDSWTAKDTPRRIET